MTGPTLTGLDLVRDQLSEARRYTRSDPETTDRLIDQAIANLAIANRALVRRYLDHARVTENLIVGQQCMAAAPDVTDAAITMAIWELGSLASELRKAEEAEERDVELMEAFGPKGDVGT